MHNTIIVGAGQSGLSVGYYLRKHGLSFQIVDANERVGDSWRKRWDSLRLFTPARYDGIAGMPFPAPRHSFPTKDEMGNYLEEYARHFNLPVQTSTRVDHVSRSNGKFVVTTDSSSIEADSVVIAMSSYQKPRVPEFARALSPGIVQLHSTEYLRPSQLNPGSVLIVGAGNSGAEIAMETTRSGHKTFLAGRDVGHVPFRIEGFASRVALAPFVLRFLFHRALTVDTPAGRKVRPKTLFHGGPLIRQKPKDLAKAGVIRAARMRGVTDGKPLMEDGQVMDVANVIWCTGFSHGLDWLDIAVFDERGEPKHRSGICNECPGLYFVGLHFLHALSSTMIHGADRDAKRIAGAIASRAN